MCQVARLGAAGLPELASELRVLLAEDMPDDPGEDALWVGLCTGLASRLDPALGLTTRKPLIETAG